MGLLNLLAAMPAKYCATVVDFVFRKRPQAFFLERQRDPTRYSSPCSFLMFNLAMAATIYAAAVPILSGHASTKLRSMLLALAEPAAHLTLVALVILTIGRSGIMRVPGVALFNAFAYASVFYPAIALATAILLPKIGAVPTAIALLTLRVTAVVYLFAAIGRTSVLPGRWYTLFVRRASAMLAAACVGIVVIGILLSGNGRDVRSELPQPLTATLPACDISDRSAKLFGAAAGPVNEEWFDVGTTPNLGYSVDSSDGSGVMSNLRPNTTYYYRYVGQRNGITCFGEVRSFKTSPSKAA